MTKKEKAPAPAPDEVPDTPGPGTMTMDEQAAQDEADRAAFAARAPVTEDSQPITAGRQAKYLPFDIGAVDVESAIDLIAGFVAEPHEHHANLVNGLRALIECEMAAFPGEPSGRMWVMERLYREIDVANGVVPPVGATSDSPAPSGELVAGETQSTGPVRGDIVVVSIKGVDHEAVVIGQELGLVATLRDDRMTDVFVRPSEWRKK